MLVALDSRGQLFQWFLSALELFMVPQWGNVAHFENHWSRTNNTYLQLLMAVILRWESHNIEIKSVQRFQSNLNAGSCEMPAQYITCAGTYWTVDTLPYSAMARFVYL